MWERVLQDARREEGKERESHYCNCWERPAACRENRCVRVRVCVCVCICERMYAVSLVPPPALTAKVGTIKRKRQVRDILDHLDSGHTDDCFGSTPFKRSKFRNKVRKERGSCFLCVCTCLMFESCVSGCWSGY